MRGLFRQCSPPCSWLRAVYQLVCPHNQIRNATECTGQLVGIIQEIPMGLLSFPEFSSLTLDQIFD